MLKVRPSCETGVWQFLLQRITSSVPVVFLLLLLQYMRTLSVLSPLFSMVSSSNRRQKVQTSEDSAKERGVEDVESSTNTKSHVKELPLRTSLVRDSVKRRIFAYMDQGDRSAEIETKSGLSHLIVKHYRRMWKDERHDARLRSLKNRSRRKACGRASSYEPVQLPLRLKPGCGQRPETCPGPKSVGDRGMRKHRAAGGV